MPGCLPVLIKCSIHTEYLVKQMTFINYRFVPIGPHACAQVSFIINNAVPKGPQACVQASSIINNAVPKGLLACVQASYIIIIHFNSLMCQKVSTPVHIWCLDDKPSHFQLANWAKWI